MCLLQSWASRAGDPRQLRALAPIQACHTYTHTLLGGKDERDTGPNGPPVSMQENTVLLSDCVA